MNKIHAKSLCALLLALVMLSAAATLPSCDRGEGDVTTAPVEETDPVEPAAEGIPIVRDGAPAVKVIRPDDAGAGLIDACRTILDSVSKVAGVSPAFGTDFIKKDEKHDAEAYEILVGLTNYDETASVIGSMKYTDYALKIVGHKIVLAAFSDKYLTFLANQLAAYIRDHADEGGNVTFGADGELQDTVQNPLSIVPVMPGVLPSANDTSDASAVQLVFESCTKEQYEAYIALVDASGLEKVASREIAGNLFNTYKNEKYALSVYYNATYKVIRAVSEPVANLFVETDADHNYKAVTTPKLFMIGDLFDSANNLSGLECMLLQLSDGRFIVVDGGCASMGFANKIYGVMKQYSGQDHVTVAAWIISHAHNDHTGGLIAIAEHFNDRVTIERVVYNFIAGPVANKIEANDAARLSNALQAHYSKTPVYKCHTGQVYQIADATLTFFYTPEDYIRGGRNFTQTKNFNDTSIIFSVDIAGQRIMFLGDAQNIANNETAASFGKELESDIVQIAHHAGVGGTAAIYNATRPIVGLVTTDDSRLNQYLSTDYNQTWVRGDRLLEYWNSDNRITFFALPYCPTEKVGFRK